MATPYPLTADRSRSGRGGRQARRPRIGMYIRGDGSGPWRSVHSLLRGFDPAEFEVVLFGDVDRYDPNPHVRVVNLGAAATPAPAGPRPVEPARAPWLRAAWRRTPQGLRQWVGFARGSYQLARVFRPAGLELLHTHETGFESLPAVAAGLAGVPRVIGTFHVCPEVDVEGRDNRLSHLILEVIGNRCLDRAIAVSGQTGADWVRRTRISGRRVTTIHNGIDPAAVRRTQPPESARGQLGLPTDGCLVVGGVGRLDPVKGYDSLIRAVGLLASEFPNLILALAGSGPDRDHLAGLAVAVGLGSRVRFLGFHTDVLPVYEALDVFVMSSLSEALPYAALEAMAVGLPVVGSAVGGIPEIIDPGRTGFLVPPRDPARLAAALRPLLKDADLRHRMGAAGRERVIREFHERDMVRKTIQVYRDLLGTARASLRGAGR
jgi:glycosyltransferase involved in cell wall biosynthesis